MPAGTIGYHPGYFRAMSDAVTLTVYGRGGHAAMPQNTVDPIVLAARIVLALQTVVSRENNPVDPVVVTVGSIHGGTQGNIIPDEVRLQLSVRTYTSEVRARTLAAIRRIAKGEADAAGAPRVPEVDVSASSNAPVYNDPALTLRLAGALKKALGEPNVVEMTQKMTSEDFAEYGLAGVPSALLHIGAVDPVKLAAARQTGIPVPAPHSPAWAPEREPTISGDPRGSHGAARAVPRELIASLAYACHCAVRNLGFAAGCSPRRRRRGVIEPGRARRRRPLLARTAAGRGWPQCRGRARSRRSNRGQHARRNQRPDSRPRVRRGCVHRVPPDHLLLRIRRPAGVPARAGRRTRADHAAGKFCYAQLRRTPRAALVRVREDHRADREAVSTLVSLALDDPSAT
jgi:hypothetical protein